MKRPIKYNDHTFYNDRINHKTINKTSIKTINKSNIDLRKLKFINDKNIQTLFKELLSNSEIKAIIERLDLILETKKLPPINQNDNIPWPLI